MDIYSEHGNGDRKATVTLIQRHWDSRFNLWEVALYVQGKPIQRVNCQSQADAEQMAESFVNSSTPTLYNVATLLNE